MRAKRFPATGRILVLAVLLVASGCTQPKGSSPEPDQEEMAAVSSEVTELLESNPAATTSLFGRTPDRVACVSRAFGLPKTSSGSSDDKWLFSHVYCAAVDPGVAFGDASTFSGPVAIAPGPPIEIKVPQDGAEYEASVRRIFPDELEKAAMNSVADEGMKRALSQQYAARQG
ncbi:hypothetical protein [Micromonospora sp. CA-248212]|uniref:hypothetical protein n=1 Tax=Micromonospora sp. CA-248212 TaxID=3239961 RepID=UPI003D8C5910